MIWLCLLPAFVTHCISAYLTYTKWRDSSLYIPLSLALTCISTTIYTLAARQLNGTKEIMLLSFAWDALMLLAFYGIPMLLKDKNMGIHSYIATAIIVAGILYFKFTIGDSHD